MHEGPVRRVHQSHDPFVNVRRQLASEMRDLVLLAEYRQRRSLSDFVGQPRSWRVHVHPNIAIALFAGIMSREYPIHFQFVLVCQRRNFYALRRARIETPAVITALYGLPIKMAVGK